MCSEPAELPVSGPAVPQSPLSSVAEPTEPDLVNLDPVSVSNLTPNPSPVPCLSSISVTGNRLFLRGLVHGMHCTILIDTGASHSFVDQRFCQQLHLPSHDHASHASSVALADGSPLPISGSCDVQFSIGSFRSVTPMLQIPLSSQIHMVLGSDWLAQHQACITYNPDTLSVIKRSRRIALPLVHKLPVAAVQSLAVPILSAMQAKKALKNCGNPFLVVLHSLVAAHNQSAPPDQPHEALLSPILQEFANVFPPQLPGLPPLRDIGHTIPLIPGSSPVNRPFFRLSPAELKEVEAQIKELLSHGLIEPSSSPFGAPILFVPKKDGSLKMCVDYRALNKLMSRTSTPCLGLMIS